MANLPCFASAELAAAYKVLGYYRTTNGRSIDDQMEASVQRFG